MHRHVHCSINVQNKVLNQIKEVIKKENPDICCFVEIEKNSNQMQKLLDGQYNFSDVTTKYGSSWLNFFPLTKGKSNGFMAKKKIDFKKVYFNKGTKRLIYEIKINQEITLFFAHFSLNKKTRSYQLLQVKKIFEETKGGVIFLGDFNILSGLKELEPLLRQNNLVLLNNKNFPTFTFHKSLLVLDLCICTKDMVADINLKIIPQPYSDHAALLLEINKVLYS